MIRDLALMIHDEK